MLAKLSFALGLFAATIVRAYLYFTHFHGVEQEYPIYIYSDKEVWYFDLIFRTWYASSFNRSPGLFFGVVLCYCYYYQDEYPIFKKIHDALGSVGRNVATFVTLWLFLFTTQSATYGLSPNPFYSLFMTISSPYQMFTICTFLWCVLNNYCTIFSHFLSSTIFQKLAYSCYAVYQIHLPIIVTFARTAYYPPYEKLMDTTEYYKYAVKVFVIATILGYLLTRFVEEPLRVKINNLVRPQRVVDVKKVD